MRYQTEMMRSIVKSETAQKLLDWVSPVYGNSYVGLWLFQAIGVLMGEIDEICETLKLETNPETATLLLDQWEDQYGIPRDTSLSVRQRRARIVAKRQTNGPCNPAALEDAIAAALGLAQGRDAERVLLLKDSEGKLLVSADEYYLAVKAEHIRGATVEVTENVAKNTFLVNIRESVPSLAPAVAVIERMKPAHLTYRIQVTTETISEAEIKTAIAITHAEQYKVEVFQ